MTQNKFWLVWNEAGNAPKKRHNTEESAYKEAHKLASTYPQHEYVVLRAVRSFKANVNVVETFFEGENFWLIDGKKIEINKDYILNATQEIVKIIACDHDTGIVIYKKTNGEIFEIKLSENRLHKEFTNFTVPEIDTPTPTETLSPKFKVGDFVVSTDDRKREITGIVFPSDDDYSFLFNRKHIIAYNFRFVGTNINEQVLETVLSPWEDGTPKHKFKVGDKVKIKDGIVPIMKNVVDIWEIEELLPLSDRARLKSLSPFYTVIVYLNELTLVE